MKFSKKLFCFIGPGASGKSSICTALSKTDLPITLSISTTTRAPRPYEIEGRDYFFVSKGSFTQEINKNNFIEYAEFAGNMYGTSISTIKTSFAENKHVILEIEIQGVKKLKESSLLKEMDCELVVIFICPPTKEELVKRFKARGADSPERINERLIIAEQEIAESIAPNFSNYVIVNKDLDSSIDQARAIIIAELSKRSVFDTSVISSFIK